MGPSLLTFSPPHSATPLLSKHTVVMAPHQVQHVPSAAMEHLPDDPDYDSDPETRRGVELDMRHKHNIYVVRPYKSMFIAGKDKSRSFRYRREAKEHADRVRVRRFLVEGKPKTEIQLVRRLNYSTRHQMYLFEEAHALLTYYRKPGQMCVWMFLTTPAYHYLWVHHTALSADTTNNPDYKPVVDNPVVDNHRRTSEAAAAATTVDATATATAETTTAFEQEYAMFILSTWPLESTQNDAVPKSIQAHTPSV